MFDTARSFFSSHRDASESVKRAEKFAVRVPIVGRVSLPPPDQLAFFGVLGALAAVGMIEWPVAVTIGVGQLVVSRHFGDSEPDGTDSTTAPKQLESHASSPKESGSHESDLDESDLDESASEEPALTAEPPEPPKAVKKAAPAKATKKAAPAKKSAAQQPAKKSTAAKKTTAKQAGAKATPPRKSAAKKRGT